MAAKETLTIEVLTAQAQRNVDALNKSINGLKTALLGLGILNVVRNTIAFADSIQDVANATKLSNAALIGFANTLSENGSNFNDALTAAERFNKSLGDLQNGSTQLNDTFRMLGFTSEELLDPNMDVKLEKTIKRLAELEKQNSSLAASAKADIFGKGLGSTSMIPVAGGFSNATKEALKYVEAQKAVAALQDKLDKSFIKLQFSILKALEPLAKKIGEIPQEKLDQMIESFVNIGKAALQLVSAFKIFSGLGSVIAGIAGYFVLAKKGADEVSKSAEQGARRTKGFQDAWKNATGVMDKAWQVMRHIGYQLKTLMTFLGGLVRFIPLIGAVAASFYLINEAVKIAFGVDLIQKFMDYVKSAGLKVLEFFGLYDSAAEEAKRKQEELNKKLKEQEEKLKEQNEQIQLNRQLMSEYKQEIQKTVDGVRQQNKQFLDQVQFNKEIANLSDDQKEIEIAKRNAIQGNVDAVKELRDKQKELKDETGKFKDITLGAEKYKEIELAIGRILAGNAGLKKAAEQDVISQQKIREEYDKQAHAVEMLQEKLRFDEAGIQLTENLSLLGLSNEELQKATRQLELQREIRKINNDYEVELLKLQQKQGELGTENYLRELEQLQQLTQARINAAKAQAAATTVPEEKNTPQTWLEGWTKAYEDFVKNIPTVAQQGQMAFQTFTQGLTDMFVNFAKTGKLSFKDLINNMIAQIVQSKIQNLIASIFNPASASGGFLSNIFGKIFGGGKASGGPVNNNKAYMVGEQGPELFMPRTNGSITPNNQLGGGPINNTYITNNINALDSKSVAQLFAENRKTLLGTIQMAQKEMPR